MKRSLRAALLAPLLFAAFGCAGGPVLFVPPELVGVWFAEIPATGFDFEPIAGTRNVNWVREWDFRADGSFRERNFARETVGGTESEFAVAAGYYGVRDDRIRLTIEAEATADVLASPWPTTLEPAPLAATRNVEVHYRREGDRLRLIYECGVDASLCPADVLLQRR